jgi:hypothetical protein
MRTINDNVEILEKLPSQAAHTKSKVDLLMASLEQETIVYEIKEVTSPRTICVHADCAGLDGRKKGYPRVCHSACSLHDIQVEKVKCEQVKQCAAFGYGTRKKCIKCGHSWSNHMHILYEPTRRRVKVREEAVVQRVNEDATAMDIVETAVESRDEKVNKYYDEYDFIEEIVAQCSVFLENTSTEPFEDPVGQYLCQLRNTWEGRFDVRLLVQPMHHEEKVAFLKLRAGTGGHDEFLDHTEIDDLVRQLYELPLVGSQLKKAAERLQEIERAANATEPDALESIVPAKRGHVNT